LAPCSARACAAPALPEPGDSTLLIDPEARGVSLLVHVRRVPGHNLWVWYRQADDFVDFLELTGHPPDR
jgi:hypothetical protein